MRDLEVIGVWLKEHPVDVLLTLGELSQTMESGKACLHFAAEDLDGLYKSLKELLQPGDCVLLKGSNSMKLGEVARRLRKTESQSAQE